MKSFLLDTSICISLIRHDPLVISKIKEVGQRVDELDLLIASTALSNDCTIVTHNVKHFNRIKELVVENWL